MSAARPGDGTEVEMSLPRVQAEIPEAEIPEARSS